MIEPLLHRIWTDHLGNVIRLRSNTELALDVHSKTANTGDSLTNIETTVDSVFKDIDKLCQSGVSIEPAKSFTDPQMALLRKITATTSLLWKGVRQESAVKSKLWSRLQDQPDAAQRLRSITSALKFLCRLHLATDTFVRAAEELPEFRSIEVILLDAYREQRSPGTKPQTALEVVRALGIKNKHRSWNSFFAEKNTEDKFQDMLKNKRFLHAELQLVDHYHTVCATRREPVRIHPYIGCSGSFRVRGTHETVMHQWVLPTASTFGTTADKFLNFVLAKIKHTIEAPFSERNAKALAQSSAAISTARTVPEQEMEHNEMSQLYMRRMMTMTNVVTEDGLLINPLYEKPGYVSVVGGGCGKIKNMTLDEAEVFSANHVRSKLDLEQLKDMPPERYSPQTVCSRSRCRRPSNLYCSACRTRYCSRGCQRKDWDRHVFHCTVKDRPRLFDYLKIYLSTHRRLGNEVDRARFLQALFADDVVCRTFGFVNCIDENDVDSLCRFWSCFLRLNIGELKDFDTNTGTLGLQVGNWIVRGSYHNRCTESELSSIQWYNERSDAFRLPQREAQYEYQLVGWYGAASAFAIEDTSSLSAEEHMVFMLYVVLLRPFNNVPDAHSPDWMNFGFYACDTLAKSLALQDLYLALVLHGIPLDRITAAYQTSTLPTLFTTLGYDTQNLRFAPPSVQELGIFRFIAEVEHALSGSYCACFQPSTYCPYRPKHETHLSTESEAEYGFHGTNTWERWQLLNFYKAVFAHESFDAAAMLRAKTQGAQALDEYLESLFPEWRRKIVNKVLGGVLLPHLGTTITWEGEKKECRCVVHCVLVPEGLGQCAASHIQELVAHRDAGQLEEGSEMADDGG